MPSRWNVTSWSPISRVTGSSGFSTSWAQAALSSSASNEEWKLRSSSRRTFPDVANRRVPPTRPNGTENVKESPCLGSSTLILRNRADVPEAWSGAAIVGREIRFRLTGEDQPRAANHPASSGGRGALLTGPI